MVIHSQYHPLVTNVSPYVLSKSAGTLFVQLLANQVPQAELQVVTMHPGTIYGDAFEGVGITEDMIPFDKGEQRKAPIKNIMNARSTY
jgi:NAD(P)-dependent dehydrogenase (short-subunit alcohol dehydrogenase family)